jgi:VIT1/CCC1 family predicted Fe2+/Mn2+ transporter
MELYVEVCMADLPYRKGPRVLTALAVAVVLLLLMLAAFASANGEFSNWTWM